MDELRNFQGVTFQRKWLIQKENAIGLAIYWNNYNFPLEIGIVLPFVSVWLFWGKQKDN